MMSGNAPTRSITRTQRVGRVNAADGAAMRPRRCAVKYLLTIYGDESSRNDITPEDGAREMAAYGTFTEDLQAAGAMLGGEGLQPTSTATTVRVRDGETLVTDGPFAETKEQLGGFYLIDVESLDEAIEIASRVPSARVGSIEVRPLMPVPARQP
jgi:hypothetical protein